MYILISNNTDEIICYIDTVNVINVLSTITQLKLTTKLHFLHNNSHIAFSIYIYDTQELYLQNRKKKNNRIFDIYKIFLFYDVLNY